MELLNQVTLSLEEYNDMRDENTELARQNREVRAAIEELQDNDGQKVIIRECEQWEDEDGEEYETRTTSVKGFDEVKAEVEEFYKEKIEDLEKAVERGKKRYEETQRKYLDAQCTISELKHRNLWQRILNK